VATILLPRHIENKGERKMELNEILTIVSLIASIASIILAIVAISLSKNASKNSKDNFKETQTLQNQTYEKTKDLLHEINIKSAVINEVVQKIKLN